MVWWAYTGFTSSIVLSIALLTWMLGMPVIPVVSLAAQTASVLLAAAAIANLFIELRKHLH